MSRERVLITGGAGFIGSNLAYRLLKEGLDVVIYDNLSRSGCRSNIAWLQEVYGRESFCLLSEDISNFDALLKACEGVGRIYHLAGQVAVTKSVTNPRQDFLDNAYGTFNVLEAVRIAGNNPILIYASTNKVYGGMENVSIIEKETRYQYENLPYGVSESQPLDFHSPYGCSKGAGDQYTRDYARIYGLRTVVMRQSCIYGIRQFGVEDQGWAAWFIIAAQKGRQISVYGDGKQVRDILFIDDLLDGYEAAIQQIDSVAGQVFNIGGGPENTISIWAEFSPIIERLIGHKIEVQYSDWRPGDQPVYISDIRKAHQELNWQPKTSVQAGVERLFHWIKEHLELFHHL